MKAELTSYQGGKTWKETVIANNVNEATTLMPILLSNGRRSNQGNSFVVFE